MLWSEALNANYINSELIGDIGTEKVATIKSIEKNAEYFNQRKQKKDTGLAIHFEEFKPLLANATNTKTLMRIFGGANEDVEKCYGRKIILYVTTTKVGGEVKNCIRIKEFSETKCDECGKVILPYTGKTVSEIIDISRRNFGKCLCGNCMVKKGKEKNAE